MKVKQEKKQLVIDHFESGWIRQTTFLVYFRGVGLNFSEKFFHLGFAGGSNTLFAFLKNNFLANLFLHIYGVDEKV